ncbi:MAG: protease modulator HflC [Methylococcaceae bacterium]|nr:protease modulator HflC [Methylococcaceae bacterium]
MLQSKTSASVGLVFLLGYLSIFTVQESEKAIKFKLGEIIRTDFEPGLHFQVPLINNIKKFNNKILTLDSKPERFLTSEKKNVIVDSYVKWQVGDVKRYYTAVSGDMFQANLRLEQIIKDVMRGEFSKRTIKDLIAEDRLEMRTLLIKNATRLADELGIKIVDIRIKRIDLPKEVSTSVFRRMDAERDRVAREFRSEGAEAAERIRADADKQHSVLLSEAYRDAEKIRGEGDAKAAEIYASGYDKDPEFFALYRSLSSYKKTFKDKDDVIILNPNSEYFRYFGKQ